MDGGGQLPAYWSHPSSGSKFPGIALIHDWWGVNGIVRRVANMFAQLGHYVIVPDLFHGKTASTPQEAMKLVEGLGDSGYPRVHTALSALENHHQCNRNVAAIGMGMGGSLAFEAAIVREDLEAAVAFSGFPHRYFGRFKDAHAPILAFYGSHEPHIQTAAVEKLRKELDESPLEHQVIVLPSIGHEFFAEGLSTEQREQGRVAINKTLEFLETFLNRAKPSTSPKAH